MKRTLLLLFILGIYNSSNCQISVFTSDYRALTVPQLYNGHFWYVNDSLKANWEFMSHAKNDCTLLRSFPNIVSNVTIYKVSPEGNLNISGVVISAKKEEYQVIYDFSQTQTLVWPDTSALIGIGVRMVAKVSTKKAGINLSSPFSLAINAEKIQGSLEVRVTGISSKTINGLIPTTNDLSASSISNALQAVATIKSHIYDEDVIISPQYLAYNIRDSSVKPKIQNQNPQKSSVKSNIQNQIP